MASPEEDEPSVDVDDGGGVAKGKKVERASGTTRNAGASDPVARKDSQRAAQRVRGTSVGLRSAPGNIAVPGSEKAQQRRKDSRKVPADHRDAHRKAVWAKLDAAKKAAEEKAHRLRSFEPAGALPVDDDDFDF